MEKYNISFDIAFPPIIHWQINNTHTYIIISLTMEEHHSTANIIKICWCSDKITFNNREPDMFRQRLLSSLEITLFIMIGHQHYTIVTVVILDLYD